MTRSATVMLRQSPPEAEPIACHDDGLVPNNATLPVLLYRQALDTVGIQRPEPAIIALLEANGWGEAWINGIYGFHHYHARVHEVLAVASGTARVQLGGAHGQVVAMRSGDAVVIPAGVGHCLKEASSDLSVVGAYPAGSPPWDLKRATPQERIASLPLIARVPLPATDPLGGADGPLISVWTRSGG